MTKFAQLAKQATKPIWKLEDGLTYSSLSKWLQCREQFVLSVIEGWTPKKISTPLTFGLMFHLCLELHFLKPDHSSKQIAGMATTAIHQDLSSKGALSKEERDTLSQIKGMIHLLYPLYVDYWGPRDEEVQWLERESRFRFDHLLHRYRPVITDDGTVKRVCKDTVIPLRGMRDGAFRDQSGDLRLFETKTKSRIDEQGLLGSLKNDFQTMLYCYSLWVEYSEIPTGVLYNVVRRPAQKFGKKDTMNSFLKRIKTDVLKRPDYYFLRFAIDITKQDLLKFIEGTLNPVLRSFLDWYEDIDKDHKKRYSSDLHYMNPNALTNQYGRCDLFDMLVRGTRYSYYQREEPFPELAWNKFQD
jgi:hypothetical protein